jgi:hypothetical protein
MPNSLLIFMTAAFLIAGFVNGVIGLGLPTVRWVIIHKSYWL